MDDLKSLLLKSRIPEANVDLPGVGTVRVRGLNRAEALRVEAAKGVEARERRILALGMVDPAITEAEAGQWQRNAPAGELDPVSTKIAELSGMLPGSAKEAVKEFVADPDAEFPVLPGAEVGDDSVPASDGDV
jgi:hypothetical protein